MFVTQRVRLFFLKGKTGERGQGQKGGGVSLGCRPQAQHSGRNWGIPPFCPQGSALPPSGGQRPLLKRFHRGILLKKEDSMF